MAITKTQKNAPKKAVTSKKSATKATAKFEGKKAVNAKEKAQKALKETVRKFGVETKDKNPKIVFPVSKELSPRGKKCVDEVSAILKKYGLDHTVVNAGFPFGMMFFDIEKLLEMAARGIK